MEQASAVIVGVGARRGVGAAVAARAARAGLRVFIVGRTRERLEATAAAIEAEPDVIGSVTAVPADGLDADAVAAVFDRAAAAGPVRLVLYNVGRNLPAPLMESDRRLVEGHWRRCVLGGLLCGQAAVRTMQANAGARKGTIIYTGASASLRGKPLFTGFASAKAAVRVMAQSMAREFGPDGIHVAHVVIDGMVDGDVVRSVGTLGRLLLRNKGADGALDPDAVADSLWMVHRQPVNAWTHELDLRPYKEAF